MYLPVRLILTLFFISCVGRSFAQQAACVDSSTVFLLKSGNSRIGVQRSIVLADSGVFIAGVIRDEGVTDASLFIARLDKFNNILFSKKLTGIIGNVRKIMQCNNGDILLGVAEANVFTIPFLFRFTINGNLIWQKRFQENFSVIPANNLGAFEMTEGPDNNFYVGLVDEIETGNFNIIGYYHVYKISSTGNLIWKTTLILNESVFSYINAIKTWNNEVLIVTQQYHTGIQACSATNYKSIGLVKLSQATGAHLASKYYCLNFYGTGCLSINDSYRNSVKFLPNGKIVIAGAIGTCDKYPYFTIETDYNFSTPQCYSYNGVVPYIISTGSIIANQFGETALFARGYNGQNFLYATFLPNGSLKIQRKIEMSPGIVLSSGSFSPVFKSPDDFLFFANQQQNNQQFLQVIEFKGSNAQITNCTGKDTSFLSSQPHAIVPITFDWDTIRFETPIIYNANCILNDFSFQREEVCSSVSICDSLKIIGPETICLNSPVQQFTAIRNPECRKLPQWKIDTSAIQSIQTINDTTVSIIFKRAWQGYLYSYSSSCNGLLDSLFIKVVPAAVPIQLGRDTTYCSPVALDAGDNFASYQWQDGSSGRYFNVDTGGIYYVTGRDLCGNIFSDTIQFSKPPKDLFIGNDTCIRQFPFLIFATSGFKTYQWQSGSNNLQYSVTAPGLYYVNAINGCNNGFSDSILISKAIQPFSLGNDTSICNQPITLSAPSGYAAYLWQDNSISNSITVSDTGSYFVNVTDNCGNTFSDSIKINPLNSYFSAGKDTIEVCKEENVQLIASPGYHNYSWQPNYNISSINSREVWVNPVINTKYVVSAEKSPGCFVSDSVFVLVKDCPTNFFVPSAFTPNNDRLNDCFGPIATAPLQHYEFWIYNRWGQLVFYSNDIKKCWDGKLKGLEQSSGVFVWRCSYKFYSGSQLSKKGTFILIR